MGSTTDMGSTLGIRSTTMGMGLPCTTKEKKDQDMKEGVFDAANMSQQVPP